MALDLEVTSIRDRLASTGESLTAYVRKAYTKLFHLAASATMPISLAWLQLLGLKDLDPLPPGKRHSFLAQAGDSN